MSAPDATEVEAAVRAEDADRVRALLAEATEADRRALAKALKPLLDGPTWERPKPIMMGSIEDGMSFVSSQMTAKMCGEEPEPSAGERERRDWWELSHTPAFAAFAVGVAGGQKQADAALDDCVYHLHQVAEAEWAAIAGVLADRNPPWLAALADARLGNGWIRGGNWPLARWLVRLGAIERPAVPEYGAGMVVALAQEPPLTGPMPTRGGERMPDPTGGVCSTSPWARSCATSRRTTSPGTPACTTGSRRRATRRPRGPAGTWPSSRGRASPGFRSASGCAPIPAEVAALAAGKGVGKLAGAARRLARLG